MAHEDELAYKYGLQSKYDSYLNYNENTLYWCTDTRKLYRGTEDYTEFVRFIQDHTNLIAPAKNVLYVESNGDGWVYIKDSAIETDIWKQVIFSNSESNVTIVTVIDDAATDNTVPSTKAVYDLFKSVNSVSKTEIQTVYQKLAYEVFDKPIGTLVDYREKEIRIFCPSTTTWQLRDSGENADTSTYYLGFKAYAPSNDVVSFKESLDTDITDDTMYYFEDNNFAGIDEYGRKFSTIWLPIAKYEKDADTWAYYGAKSTIDKYIGWYYRVDWYNTDGIVVASDLIRINLSNEDCYYSTDELSTLTNKVDTLEDYVVAVSTWQQM